MRRRPRTTCVVVRAVCATPAARRSGAAVGKPDRWSSTRRPHRWQRSSCASVERSNAQPVFRPLATATSDAELARQARHPEHRTSCAAGRRRHWHRLVEANGLARGNLAASATSDQPSLGSFRSSAGCRRPVSCGWPVPDDRLITEFGAQAGQQHVPAAVPLRFRGGGWKLRRRRVVPIQCGIVVMLPDVEVVGELCADRQLSALNRSEPPAIPPEGTCEVLRRDAHTDPSHGHRSTTRSTKFGFIGQ